jgi:hypothetical protein
MVIVLVRPDLNRRGLERARPFPKRQSVHESGRACAEAMGQGSEHGLQELSTVPR